MEPGDLSISETIRKKKVLHRNVSHDPSIIIVERENIQLPTHRSLVVCLVRELIHYFLTYYFFCLWNRMSSSITTLSLIVS